MYQSIMMQLMGNKKNNRELGSLFSKNQEYVVDCLDMNHEGFGVVKIDDYVVFVKGLLTHEQAKIKLTKVLKNYAYAMIVNIIKPSEFRVEPRCSVYKQCGGCDIMHANYTFQKEFKRNLVKQQFDYHGLNDLIINDVLGMEDPWNYRNKVSCPVNSTNEATEVGFYRQNSHDIVQFETCQVQSDLQNQVIVFIREFLITHPMPALRHIVLRESTKKTLMVGLVAYQSSFDYLDKLVEALVDRFHNITSILLNINDKNTNTIFGDQDVVLFGDSFIVDSCLGYQFKISLRSFYQVNPTMMEVLYQEALNLANIQPNEVVLDCYCGIGTIALVASGKAKHVYGVEVNEKAVEDAQENAILNHVDNVSFHLMDAKEALTYFNSQHVSIDTMIVDPPRSGLHESLVEAIIESGISKVIYVSCNPKTLARDCAKLANAYHINVVQPVDMFGQTKHVETVVLLSKQDVDHHVKVKLEMDELDLTASESKATYEEIRDYVLKNHNMKVSNLYISQIIRKCGLEAGKNYNTSKKENPIVPNCPPEKEEAIRETLLDFKMI